MLSASGQLGQALDHTFKFTPFSHSSLNKITLFRTHAQPTTTIGVGKIWKYTMILGEPGSKGNKKTNLGLLNGKKWGFIWEKWKIPLLNTPLKNRIHVFRKNVDFRGKGIFRQHHDPETSVRFSSLRFSRFTIFAVSVQWYVLNFRQGSGHQCVYERKHFVMDLKQTSEFSRLAQKST